MIFKDRLSRLEAKAEVAARAEGKADTDAKAAAEWAWTVQLLDEPAFLARAMEHPPSSPERCAVIAEQMARRP